MAFKDDMGVAVRCLLALVASPSEDLDAIRFDEGAWRVASPTRREVEIRKWLALAASLDQRCGTCRWYEPSDAITDNPPEDQMNWCEWPADSLPWSLRFGNRERLMVGPLDGGDCRQ